MVGFRYASSVSTAAFASSTYTRAEMRRLSSTNDMTTFPLPSLYSPNLRLQIDCHIPQPKMKTTVQLFSHPALYPHQFMINKLLAPRIFHIQFKHLVSLQTTAKMSTYTGQVPSDVKLDPRIVPFYENFYRVSDDPSDAAHDEYVDSMTPDGTLIMGSKKSAGKDELMTLRKGLWSGPVKTRKHHLHRIYPFGASSDPLDCMLHGNVDYGLKNGKSLTVDWAAHAQFVDVGGKLKMKFYQVYLDSAPVAQAASS